MAQEKRRAEIQRIWDFEHKKGNSLKFSHYRLFTIIRVYNNKVFQHRVSVSHDGNSRCEAHGEFSDHCQCLVCHEQREVFL